MSDWISIEDKPIPGFHPPVDYFIVIYQPELKRSRTTNSLAPRVVNLGNEGSRESTHWMKLEPPK